MRQEDFEALISDTTKHIDDTIVWEEDEDHSPSFEFRVAIDSEARYPLFVKGSYNALAQTLTYALIHRFYGRIYGLDLGKDHHNPTCTNVGRKHKHRWNEPVRDKEAYVPEDITATVGDPIAVWKQFCIEAKILHNGVMQSPPPSQLELFL